MSEIIIFLIFILAFPSCEVGVMVQRGTTWKAAPRQRVTVECPVSHCGQSLNVTWCKLLDGKKCEPINGTDNVEIRQDDQHAQGELISFLTFKRISIDDDGLYRCDVEEYRYIQINHIINISVSGWHFVSPWMPNYRYNMSNFKV